MLIMKRFFSISAIFFLLFLSLNAFSAQLRISKNTFLRAVNQRDISTSTADVGDSVSFVIQEPFYVGENVVVDEGDMLLGYIEDIKLPVEGNNASMKIKINRLLKKNGKTIPINAYVWTKNKNVIGGEMTPPMYYDKVPHYSQWQFGDKGGVLQLAPSGVHYFGTHTVLKAGAVMNIVLSSDLVINN